MAFNTDVSAGMAAEQKNFLTKVYGWMALALIISGVAAFFGGQYIQGLMEKVYANQDPGPLNTVRTILIVLAIVEFVLVMGLTFAINRISAFMAACGFILYSLINGLTLSTIFVSYTEGTIYQAFGTASVTFIAMVLYGTFTKSNIQAAGKYLYMGLMGIIFASLIQFIMHLCGANVSGLSLVISIVTVIVFTGLTAYDTNKLLRVSQYADGSDMFKKASIIGALELYLDFINIFLALLRIFGRNRD